MRFGIDKCVVLAMCRFKEPEYEWITIGSGEVIGKTDDDGYKYLGIIERTDICQEQMKICVKTECFKCVRSALKWKANAVPSY